MREFIVVLLFIVAFAVWIMKNHISILNPQDSRTEISYKIFDRAVTREYDYYIMENFNKLMTESKERQVSVIKLHIDLLRIFQKLPEFDIDLIQKNTNPYHIWLEEKLRDQFFILVDKVEFLDTIIQTNDRFDFVIKIKIYWHNDQ